jgi:poly [ADP-ribose] polymerase
MELPLTSPVTSSSPAIARHMFVLADVAENSNKFWEAILETSGVRCKWGRVGSGCQEKFYPGETASQLQSRIREKTRKGYKEVALIEQSGNAANVGAVDNRALAQVASAQIAQGDSELADLVTRLAEANRHEIVAATGGAITFNAQGMAQTALGIVQKKSVVEARTHLKQIARAQKKNNLDDSAAMESIAAYMQLIPQKVGARRGWHTGVFGTPELIAAQYDLLDKLEQSIVLAQKAVEAQLEQSAVEAKARPVFEVKLSRLKDKKEIARITSLFVDSTNARHVSASLRIKAIYVLEIPAMRASYEADGGKLGGIRELWHGTRIFNVLSILKSGLVIPRSTDGHVTGRMFGDGLYFSDQSSKAANYAAGYWDGSFRPGTKQQCFMFLADVAMGRAYTPPGRVAKPPAGYDSVFAKAGESSVHNNEMIVYRLGQANLKYLVELEG